MNKTQKILARYQNLTQRREDHTTNVSPAQAFRHYHKRNSTRKADECMCWFIRESVFYKGNGTFTWSLFRHYEWWHLLKMCFAIANGDNLGKAVAFCDPQLRSATTTCMRVPRQPYFATVDCKIPTSRVLPMPMTKPAPYQSLFRLHAWRLTCVANLHGGLCVKTYPLQK